MKRSSVKGVGKTSANIAALVSKAEEIAEEETEKTVRRVASEAAVDAPVDTGKLSNSLPAGVEKLGPAEWGIIDGTDYTLVQEYTHASKKAFIRKAIWNNEDRYPAELKARLKKEL